MLLEYKDVWSSLWPQMLTEIVLASKFSGTQYWRTAILSCQKISKNIKKEKTKRVSVSHVHILLVLF